MQLYRSFNIRGKQVRKRIGEQKKKITPLELFKAWEKHVESGSGGASGGSGGGSGGSAGVSGGSGGVGGGGSSSSSSGAV
jgi:hypothetical protein